FSTISVSISKTKAADSGSPIRFLARQSSNFRLPNQRRKKDASRKLPNAKSAARQHSEGSARCPLYPRKRTCAVQLGMSAIGQKRTSVHLFDYLVGATVEGTLLPKIRLTLRQ